MADTPTPIIAFDFDGTLTTEDTFVLFMKHYCGTLAWYLKMVPLLPTFIAYRLGRIDRHAVKHAVVKAVFTGESQADLAAAAQKFASDVIPTLIRPEGLERFQQRLAEAKAGGPDVIVCSASIRPYLESYLAPFGVRTLLCCELEFDAQNVCTGRLAGLNVWGENKMKVIRSAFGSSGVHMVEAYGDSAGDRAMLEASDTAFWRPFRVA